MALKVLVVGGGIGGLTAAVGLRKQGHEVIILEKSALAREPGAALHLAPNANGLLRRLGIYAEEHGANLLLGMVEHGSDGSVHFNIDLKMPNSIWQHEWLLSHRVSLHDALKAAATSTTAAGKPCILRTSNRVASIDPSGAAVTLDDGSVFSGDLVIGADGVGSIARTFVRGGNITPFDSGKSAYRFLIPRKQLLENPVSAKAVSRDGIFAMWVGVDRRLVMYPCANNTIMNFVAIHPSRLSKSDGEGFEGSGSKENLLELFKEFDPVVLTMLDQAEPESLKLWTLLDMDQLPTWVNDKLALLGDAAHPFLPHQAQGGAAAIEDAMSLSAVLPFGTQPADVPERLHLYEKIRYERAHAIQQFTRLAGRDLDQQEGGKLDITKYTNYNFGHDEWHNSNHHLQKFLWSKLPVKSWRQPLGFGPSPRQMTSQMEFIKRSIRFKTSRTYLQTLFPSVAFSFTTPGTVVEATLQVKTVDELGGHNSFGLWIHGVRYTKRDGTNIFGTYLPVVFETLSDSITAGREELGMPKVFCDIGVDERNSSTHVACSWRGATFATLEWDGLTEDHPESNAKTKDPAPAHDPRSPPPPPDGGLLIYKYVPAVGNLGHADAEYPVFIPNKASRNRVVRTFNARSAKVNITAGNWDTLPTIHHIAQGLSKVPIYSIVEAKVERGLGHDDFSQAEKLEESTRSIGPHL